MKLYEVPVGHVSLYQEKTSLWKPRLKNANGHGALFAVVRLPDMRRRTQWREAPGDIRKGLIREEAIASLGEERSIQSALLQHLEYPLGFHHLRPIGLLHGNRRRPGSRRLLRRIRQWRGREQAANDVVGDSAGCARPLIRKNHDSQALVRKDDVRG